MTALSFQTTFAPLDFPFREYSLREVPEVELKAARMKAIAREFLLKPVEIEPFFNSHIFEVFDFRIAALRWFVENRARIDDFPGLFEASFEDLESRPGHAVLCENLAFALRTNIRSIRQLAGNNKNGMLNNHGLDFSQMEMPPALTYEMYLTTLGRTLPGPILMLMTDWFHASLAIEFSICIALVMARERIETNQKTVDDLAGFVASAGQEFGAITMEIRKIGQAPKNLPSESQSEKVDMLKQFCLAEQGLPEYAAELAPYDFN